MQWQQVNIDEPVAQENFERLEVGQDDLTSCLEILGAPTLIEDFEGEDQFALLWTWLNTESWGFSVSAGRYSPFGSLSYTGATKHLRAVRLLFDVELELIAKQQGMLSGLLHDYASAEPSRRRGR